MRLLVVLHILIAYSFALPEGRDKQDLPTNPIYKLRGSVNVLVEHEPGVIISTVQPSLFLRIKESPDPTNNLVCKFLQNDYEVFFITPNTLTSFVKSRVSRTVVLEREFENHPKTIPWVVFLKKENIYGFPSRYRKIYLRSSDPADPWELGVYALAPSSIDALSTAEYPDDILSAPPPFFPSLCVSPEKPRPFPVLFAPSSPAAMTSSLGSYSAVDFSPAVVIGVQKVPQAASPTSMSSAVSPSLMDAPTASIEVPSSQDTAV